jgi:pimeloyl-ACP methyl ester carboxylesterase
MRVGFAFLGAFSVAVTACSAGSPPASAGDPAEAPVTSPPAQPEAPATNGPKLETVPCRFVAPRSVEGKSFFCADLSVPENRRKGDSRTIKLHVAVVKGKAGGVPTVELVGGPGGGSDSLVGGVVAKERRMMEVYGRFLEQGDLVFFDQRGTGRSVPRLSCGFDEELADCKTRLEGQGIDLAAYDTVENADDVHDLKLALGAPKMDLHGISYGTRLGIEILKRHAYDVRAAILDGVMPSDVAVLGGFELAMDGVITKVFRACEADAKCVSRYPSLEDAFVKLHEKLDTTPFKTKDPMSGESYDLDWMAFTSDLVQRAYEEGQAARLPYLVHRLLTASQAEFDADRKAEADALDAAYAAEDAAEASNELVQELRELQYESTEEDYLAAELAQGMYLSVTCNDYAQHESLEKALAALGQVRAPLRDEATVRREFEDCKSWPVRSSDPNLRAAPSFAGRVLVIGGALDPATPASWAEHLSASLPNDQLVVVPTGGHGLMDACGATIKGAFLTTPESPVAASCAESRSIQFYYPEATAFRSLRPVSVPHVLMPPAKTPAARVADRVLAAALPSFGISSALYRRRVALRRH